MRVQDSHVTWNVFLNIVCAFCQLSRPQKLHGPVLAPPLRLLHYC